MSRRLCLLICFLVAGHGLAAESLPPLEEEKVPQGVKELWTDYDSTKEPLDVNIVREWQEDGVTVRYLTYKIGTFKGKKSTMAAFYGFPTKHDGKIPALIQMHGGGQRASVDSAKYGAENGYACLSINWGGREMEKAEPGDPGTDWGAVDATQTGHNGHYGSLMPDNLTVDAFESPRNNNWFLIIMAAKRGITLLQNQPEVDGNRIGAFGHSMGGKLAVMLSGSDDRIKAAAPSCGGCGSAPDSVRNRKNSGVRRRKSQLYHKTIDDAQYIKEIKIPILYVGPHNDFNGILDNMYVNWREMPSKTINYTVTPHMNHRAIPEHAFANLLFFEDHLKGAFDFPKTPGLTAKIKTKDGIPSVVVSPDKIERVTKVDVYYSSDSHILTRFWRTADSVRMGNTWEAQCPVMSAKRHLFIMANVYYELDHKLVGYRWSRKQPATFGISSEMLIIKPEELRNAGVKGEFKRERVIQASFNDYQDWYRLDWNNPAWWSASTRKIKDPVYVGPDGAELLLGAKVDHDVTIFFELRNNNWGAYSGEKSGHYYAELDLKGSDEWQTVRAMVDDFKPVDSRTKQPLKNWRHITELSIRGRIRVEKDGKTVELGGRWPAPRSFRNLRWEGGTYPKDVDVTGRKLSEPEFKRQFQKGIEDSLKRE